MKQQTLTKKDVENAVKKQKLQTLPISVLSAEI